jgi:phosphatidylglycerol:prolipoprotein diacylglycerol transferase
MFYHNIDPVFLSMGSIEIRYYSLVYFFGFLFSWIILKKWKFAKDFFKKDEHADDFTFYLMFGALVGARLFYVLFYSFGNLIENPLTIFMIWNGGMSIHGGILGGIFGITYFIKKHKKHKYSFLKFADLVTIFLAISLAFGRIGNFMNGELWGRITTVPWATKFKNAEGFRHPSQLYESAKNFLIFFILLSKSKKGYLRGELLAWFLILYSTLRFLVEFIREPEIYMGPLTMGQTLSIPMFIAGIWIYRKYVIPQKK